MGLVNSEVEFSSRFFEIEDVGLEGILVLRVVGWMGC